MATQRTVQFVFKTDGLNDIQNNLGQIGNKAKKVEVDIKQIGTSMKNIGAKMNLMFTLPILAGFGYAINSASNLQETINKVDVSFGDSSKAVKEWSKTTIASFGIASQTALDMSALFGDMATGMGVSQEEASKLSMNLVGLAGDLASFKNVQLDVAQTALAGIFTGETESLKRLGYQY